MKLIVDLQEVGDCRPLKPCERSETNFTFKSESAERVSKSNISHIGIKM